MSATNRAPTVNDSIKTQKKRDSLPPWLASLSAQEVAETCPKFPALVPTWKTCGKAGCKCGRGQPHGPYWSLRWRDGATHRRRYVRPADLDEVRAAVERRRQLRASVRAAFADDLAMLRRLAHLQHELEAVFAAEERER